MRLYPKGQFEDFETADSLKNNKVLNGYAEIVNGNLTGINFGPDTIRREERAVETFYKTTIFTDASTISLTDEEIKGGPYIIPEYSQDIEFEDGVVIGAINITYTRFQYEDYNPLYPLSFPDIYVRYIVYLDGNIVAETDRLYNKFYSINLPFMFQTTAGPHRIEIGIVSNSVFPNDGTGRNQVQLYNTHQFFRNIKR